AAGQLLAAGAGTAGVLLATSPGVVIAALTIISVMVRKAPLNRHAPGAAGHTNA
ncbi:3-(3-hydroxy-phenyl)propionate transporter MhpT, partial [Pseudomonas sp. MAFF 301514]|nr:3-(3-hydroxy-phenyl)propionate transporter MhpT [Pseudomonas allii]